MVLGHDVSVRNQRSAERSVYCVCLGQGRTCQPRCAVELLGGEVSAGSPATLSTARNEPSGGSFL